MWRDWFVEIRREPPVLCLWHPEQLADKLFSTCELCNIAAEAVARDSQRCSFDGFLG